MTDTSARRKEGVHSASRARRARWLGLALTSILVALGAVVRARAALSDSAFRAGPAEGLLKSDPGLLVYIVQRIVESGGAVPDDFHRDMRLEWPDGFDIPAHLPVAQEFALAWAYRAHLAAGGSTPLHVFCLVASGAFASLVVVGVYGLALELSGSVLLALLSAALATALPANYRTLGFVFMDEDFSLPFLALHFALLARACRVRTPRAAALAALALGGALATWHAASFFAALEAACILAWTLRTGRNPLAVRGAWVFPLVLVACATIVPFLRTTLFVASAPMLVIYALWIAAFLERGRPTSRSRSAAVVIGTLAVLALLSFALAHAASGGQGEYAHVFELVWAKLRHLGALPDDPNELSMDARLMWQSSFNTLDLAWGGGQLACALLAIPVAVRLVAAGWLHPGEDPRTVIAATLALLSLVVAWLVSRTIVLPGLLLPALAAPFFLYAIHERWRIGSLACLVFAQAVLFASYLQHYENPWYRPEQRQAEIAALVRAIEALVPEGEAIACDTLNGPAILLNTRRPIVAQPKWESRESRARFEELLWALYHDSAEDFRRLLREKFRCRYLVVDRITLGPISSYAAGVPRAQSAAFAEPAGANDAAVRALAVRALLGQRDQPLPSVPGYRLLYRSPRTITWADGTPTDLFRLFELTDT